MTRETAVTWAIFGYGCLALVLAGWAAYEAGHRIKQRFTRKGRHRHEG